MHSPTIKIERIALRPDALLTSPWLSCGQLTQWSIDSLGTESYVHRTALNFNFCFHSKAYRDVTQCSLMTVYETTRGGIMELRNLSLNSCSLHRFHCLWTMPLDQKFSRQWRITLPCYGVWHRIDRKILRFERNISRCRIGGKWKNCVQPKLSRDPNSITSQVEVWKIKYPVVWIRERTIPTERRPLVGEVSANFCG
jgi:hypothetical protein